MNDIEREELEVLSGARRALSPAAEDGERVLAATLRALSAPAAGDLQPEASVETTGSALSTVLRVPSRLSQLALALSIAGASGAVGYELGRRSAVSELQRAPQVAASVEPRVQPPASASIEPAARAEASADPAIEASVVDTAPAPTAASRSRPSRAAPNRPEIAAAAVPAAPRAPAQSLELEIRVLQRVERALREHDPRRALELLGELDRSVPGGKLGQERDAAFVMARCALGFGTPESLLREFSRRHQDSVYFARVREACLGHDAEGHPSSAP